MQRNLQKAADLVTYIQQVFNEKLHFCAVSVNLNQYSLINTKNLISFGPKLCIIFLEKKRKSYQSSLFLFQNKIKSKLHKMEDELEFY